MCENPWETDYEVTVYAVYTVYLAFQRLKRKYKNARGKVFGLGRRNMKIKKYKI